MEEKSFVSQEDLILTKEEMDELRQRAVTDRISRVCYNIMKGTASNPFIDLYKTTTVLIQTEIINKLKDKTFVFKEDSFSGSLIKLFDSLPKMCKGMQDLKSLAYGKDISGDSESKTEIGVISTESLAEKHKDKKQ